MTTSAAKVFRMQVISNVFQLQVTFQESNIMKFHQKYKFSRAKWYEAEFDERYYFEVEKWCTAQFGKHDKCPDAWSRWWHRYESSIHFRDEKDYILFLLKWT